MAGFWAIENLPRTLRKAKTPGYVPVKIKPDLFLKVACSVLGKKREEVTGAGKERVRVREVISSDPKSGEGIAISSRKSLPRVISCFE
jgi:hypothetical protein